MEEVTVRIVTLELDLQGSREVEGLGSRSQSGLDIVGLLGHRQRADALEVLHTIFILDLFLVVGDKGFLFDIAVVFHGAHGRRTVSEAAHRGEMNLRIKAVVTVMVERGAVPNLWKGGLWPLHSLTLIALGLAGLRRQF